MAAWALCRALRRPGSHLCALLALSACLDGAAAGLQRAHHWPLASGPKEASHILGKAASQQRHSRTEGHLYLFNPNYHVNC